MEIFVIFLLVLASALASGYFFAHQRLLTYIATIGVLTEGVWLFLTWVSRSVEDTRVYWVGAGVFFIWSLFLVRRWRTSAQMWKNPAKDVAVLVVMGITLVAAWSIVRLNGFQADGSWLTHGFYNGDTTTFVSLVQRSLTTDGLVHQNPFAGNGELEYPTLLHAAVANFVSALGITDNWLFFLPIMTLVQIVLTVPIFFLLWDLVWPAPPQRWQLWLGVPSRLAVTIIQAVITLLIMMASWDTFVYPQSHFFLTGLFLLVVCLWINNFTLRGQSQIPLIIFTYLLATALGIANAVTGTAAIAIVGVFGLLRANDKKRPVMERGIFLLTLPVLAAIFLLATPGNAALGLPHFSYTAALDMLRLTPLLVVLAIGIMLNLSRQPVIAISAVALSALACVIFIFSTRDIIVDNASRFFYHALLIGFPLMISPLLRVYYWLKRELVYTTHSLAGLATGWAMVAVAVGLLVLPGLASVASAHDHLMFKDPQHITLGMRLAMDWVNDNIPTDSVVIASPDAPWAVPLFTGRSLLRTDYWLSPDDVVLADVKAALAGEKAAQEKILPQADYLLLTFKERKLWEPLPLEKIFDNVAVAIYKIK